LTEAEPCLEPNAGFAARLGHSNPHYALADAQRNALTHLLAAQHGEVVTVNGPPGTGKTTLLLSVVASLWAKAALDRGDAPIIFASSTNNQAVTNIIDAFGTDFSKGEGPFAGRWLPGLASFASYFPARSRKVPDVYLTQTFFDHAEDADYIERARSAFLRAATIAFPDLEDLRVETVVAALHGVLRAQADALTAIETAWQALVSTRDRVRAALGDDPAAVRETRRRAAEAAEEANRQAHELGAAWDRHQAGEPLLQILFGWLPPVARKRLGGARAALSSHWPGPLPNWKSTADIRTAIAAIAEEARAGATKFITSLAEADALLEAERACLERWRAALHGLGIDRGEARRMTLADCDALADRRLRFPIFLTTTHYWEGRWLLDMAAIEAPADEKRRRGRGVMIPRWRRRMKLTPCAVSTFYVLPEIMCARRYDDGTFVSDYLYDTIDLLIVDEAGQVTPEVAGAAFALARRALVIGDTSQIEPIWEVPSRVDAGNLLDIGFLNPQDEQAGRNPFAESGRAASSGSVMRIAQHVSRYHQDPELARGLVLYEHRRCFDEIISYCNDLCYRGRLKPLRGRKSDATGPGADGLPAMGYLQIDGLCEQLPGGSRRNTAEAETIAGWISERKATLEQSYPELTLSEILGIVTPFTAQVQAIHGALSAVGIDAEPSRSVTVGSVHAFQGAQRPVMIFSPTYSKHADGNFIDMSTSMLNVAVSRAMSSFLVFGDMNCFSAAPRSSPRGLLGARLFSVADNVLNFAQAPRRDLIRRDEVEHLRDAAAHDAFLRDVLARSRREVQVVTPWLTQHALVESGLIPALSAAVARGIALTVYTDHTLNAHRVARDRRAIADLARALDTLREVGADLIEVFDVHSKIVMADNGLFCVGSFNWFSAARDGAYARHETSVAYKGPAVANEIAAMKASLHARMAR
jgi:KaiC/GvpD/RAD55 family RecA-like ATPase